MKKTLFSVIFIFFALVMTAQVKESKKIYKLQKAYIYLDEELLISESDLNCSYFIKDSMPQEIKIIASDQPDDLRGDFTDNDKLFIDKGSQDGLKEGDLLQLMGQGRRIRGFGRYFLKKSLAEITCIYEDRSVIQLKSGCQPVHVGDFAVMYKPEKTVFAKKIDYLLCRIPANPVSGTIVYTDLWSGLQASISGSSQYVTVDLGQGVVAKGSFLLITRTLKRDLPPLIIGIGIVIQAENTNSTVKILDASYDIRVNDRVVLLPVPKAGTAGADGDENIPIVDTLEAESQGEAQAGEITPADDSLNIDVFFDFDSKQPKGEPSADFTAIKEFIAAKSEYIVTLRGYTCSIGQEEYNLRLAQARVEAIKNILISQYAVDGAHIETFFYGEKEADFDNSSEAERQKNRRVRITVSGK
jgi:outer membrane protein OmpA-like peptidoglycan-associated protein